MSNRYVPETGFEVDTDLVYNLKQSTNRNGIISYRDGKPQMGNDISIRLLKVHDSKMSTEELHDFAKYIAKCANDYLFIEFNASFDKAADENLVGRTVMAAEGMYSQRVGIIEHQFPAGELDTEIIYNVRFSTQHMGQYKIDQFDILD